MASLDAERRRVADELERLQKEAAALGEDRARILDRCTVIAQQMNAFQAQLPESAAIGGLVDVDPQDLTFYVGNGRWDHTLGEERRVLFFLAYHFGLFRVESLRQSPYPGLAILDNPFQQDLPDFQVQAALAVLSDSVGALGDRQLIVATRRPLEALVANRIPFQRQFNPRSPKDGSGTSSTTGPKP